MKRTQKQPAAKTATIPEQIKKATKIIYNYDVEPLPATFTLVAILGLIITTVFTISGRIGISWGVAFDLVFGLMLIASMISITPN